MGLISTLIFISLLNYLFVPFTFSNKESDYLQTYIVHVQSPEGKVFPNSEELNIFYNSFLSTTGSSSRIVHTYKHVMKGFAAKLTPDEVKSMENYSGFLHARPEKIYTLSTTHSPDFLGLHQNSGFWKDSNYGKGVIIGVLDTGILPGHLSFRDEGIPTPPAKWKGKCEFNFTACNNKLIGARNMVDESPLDGNGHGSHTASTAAGNFVKGANLFGQAYGTAAGMAPMAHLAIYKVCYGDCPEGGILAAMDAAIEDGVDVLSLSLVSSPDNYPRYTFDGIALGSFSAIQKGIFVSCAAGNDGPDYNTLSNEAPWILTVGASTIDRKVQATAVLGNKQKVINGEAYYQPKDFPPKLYPLIYPRKDDPFCLSSKSLRRANVRGKIVVCDAWSGSTFEDKAEVVKNAGGVAVIIVSPESMGLFISTMEAFSELPSTQVTYVDGLKIKAYIQSTSNPNATISFKGTIYGDSHAPVVASFSSRGPSITSPGILKPDIIGPGVNILAASPYSIENNKKTKNEAFNVMSGTSMSCPHLSGIAALLKSAHPVWSPAAIKSAIMTSADTVDLAHNPIEDETLTPTTIFAIGAGHVNPSHAADPGLIYDIEPKDYIPYLCGLGYSTREITIITQQKVNCSQVSSIPEAQLNYPSFSIQFGPPHLQTQTYTRTLTNVGEANSSYIVKISPPKGVRVVVKPNKLEFTTYKQKITYQVTFTKLHSGVSSDKSQGFLVWTSAKYSVRTPIAVLFLEPQ